MLDALNDQLAPHGLEFGPEPATHDHCTLGGMIGNNSCGATAQRTARRSTTSSRSRSCSTTAPGCGSAQTTDDEYAEIRAPAAAAAPRSTAQLRALRDDVRRRDPSALPRHSPPGLRLQPRLAAARERTSTSPGARRHRRHAGHRAARRADARPARARPRRWSSSAIPTSSTAADAVPPSCRTSRIALEGIDHRLIYFDAAASACTPTRSTCCPRGNGWLMVQFGGDTHGRGDAPPRDAARDLGEAAHDADVAFFDDRRSEEQLWEVREVGARARPPAFPAMPDTWPGWEDSAVAAGPARRLPARPRAAVRASSATTAPSLYGHFGQGCVHTRIPFDLRTADGVAHVPRASSNGPPTSWPRYGGSLSGEHGDGQARGELLPIMFGDRIDRAPSASSRRSSIRTTE